MTDFDIIMKNFADEPKIYTRNCIECGTEFEYDHQYGAQKQKCDECAKKRTTYVKVGRGCNNPVVVLGYVAQPGIDQEDYDDFYTGQEFSFDEVCYMIKFGSFTPGIVLYREGAQKVIVIGEGENQEVRIWNTSKQPKKTL